MTLEAVGTCTTGQHQRCKHCERCKNPAHLKPPFARPSRGSTGGKSGGLLGDLRAYLGRYPSDTSQILPAIRPTGARQPLSGRFRAAGLLTNFGEAPVPVVSALAVCGSRTTGRGITHVGSSR